MQRKVARVLVDNGSALNVCPLVTIQKLGIDRSTIRTSNTTVRAFDGSKREVLGDIELPVQIGPYTFDITFQVLYIPAAYNFLLGRPWVHSAGLISKGGLQAFIRRSSTSSTIIW